MAIPGGLLYAKLLMPTPPGDGMRGLPEPDEQEKRPANIIEAAMEVARPLMEAQRHRCEVLLPDGERPPGVDILLAKPVTRDSLAAAIAKIAA